MNHDVSVLQPGNALSSETRGVAGEVLFELLVHYVSKHDSVSRNICIANYSMHSATFAPTASYARQALRRRLFCLMALCYLLISLSCGKSGVVFFVFYVAVTTVNPKRLLLSLVLSCLFVASANARTIGRQTISVNIPGLTGTSWLSQLIATLKFNGSASVLNANPVLIVLIDDAGNHRISSSAGNPVSMTITYDQVTNQFSINGTPAGVGLAGGSSTTNIPNLFQWTIAIDAAGKVSVQVVEVKDGVTKHYEFFVAEVNENSYTPVSFRGIDRGTVNPAVYSGLMSFLSLLSLPSLPNGVVTVGTPVPIDPPPETSDSAKNR